MNRYCVRLFGFILIAGLLAACAPAPDADQARMCRQAIPALNPDGTTLTILSTGIGERRHDVLIAYDAAQMDRAPRRRTLLCRFSATGLDAGRAELVGIATETGPIADASLYFLKRFYLQSPEALAADPGLNRVEGEAALPFALAYLLQHLVLAIPMAAIYGLIASGYALMFGLAGRLHLGFGEFAAVGGAATIIGAAAASSVPGILPALALLISGVVGMAAAGWHGRVAARLIAAPLRKASGQQVLIATAGLSIMLSEYIRLTQGTRTFWLSPIWNEPTIIARAEGFAVTVTPLALLIGAVGFGAASLLLSLMGRSAFGRSWRAFSDDSVAAQLFGIDARGLTDRTYALACACAGLAGVLVAVLYGGVGFAGGFGLGLKALIAAIVGGAASVPGAFLGGVLIALFEALWSAYLPIEMRDIALYAVLIAFLIWRPGGLLGYADSGPRRV